MGILAPTIEVNFKNAINQANELENIANDLRNLSDKKFNSTLQQISSSWKGESAALYVNKGNSLEEQLTKTAKEIEKTAQTIKSNAKRIYDAEMKALEIVNTIAGN